MLRNLSLLCLGLLTIALSFASAPGKHGVGLFAIPAAAQENAVGGWPGYDADGNVIPYLIANDACISAQGQFIPAFGYAVGLLIQSTPGPQSLTDAFATPGWTCRYTAPDRPPATIFLLLGCASGYVGIEGSCVPEDSHLAAEACGTCTAPHIGQPTSISSGAKYEVFTDYAGTGPRPFDIKRTYRSVLMPMRGNGLGLGWRTHLTRELDVVIPGLQVIVTSEDGTRERFGDQFDSNVWQAFTLQSDANGAVWTYRGERGRMTEASPGVYEHTDQDERIDRFEPVSGRHRVTQTRWPGGYQRTYVYTTGGDLIEIADNLGKSLHLTWAGSRIDTITLPGGLVIDYDYTLHAPGGVATEHDVLTAVTRRDGAGNVLDTMSYEYETPLYLPLLTGVIDRNGIRAKTITYDQSGRVTSSERAGGADRTVISYGDSALGAPADTRTVTNALGQVEVFTMERHASFSNVPIEQEFQVTRVDREASLGIAAASRQNGFSGSLRNQSFDLNGTRTTYTYNSDDDEIERVVDADGEARVITTTWHPDFHAPTQIARPDRTTDFTYGPTGELTSRTESIQIGKNKTEARTTTYTWTATGQLASVDGPRTDVADVTTYAYDGAGNLTTITNPLGHVTSFAGHDARGLPASAVDPNGVVTDFIYDALGRLLSATVQGPVPAVTTYVYDAEGQLLQLTDPLGATTTFTYDDARRLTAIENHFGERMNFTLDAMGNRTESRVLASDGSETWVRTAAFDALGRLTSQLGGAGQAAGYGYDALGNRTETTSAVGGVSARLHDAFNRVVQITDALDQVTQIGYDSSDNLSSVVDANGVITSYEYNGFGELVEEDSADAGKTVHEYDEAGNLAKTTDPRGVKASYTYDSLGRVMAKTFAGKHSAESVTYGYDDQTGGNFGLGRLTDISDANSTTSYIYDAYGNRTTETRTLDGLTTTTAHTYDLAGNIVRTTYPSGRIAHFTRDPLGRVVAVDWQADATAPLESVVSAVTYRPFGPIGGAVLGNGVTLSRAHDGDYRLVGLQATTTGGTMLQDLSLTLDAAGSATAIFDALDPARDRSHGFDLLGQLTAASGPWGTDAYAYDGVGNRLSHDRDGTVTSYVHGANDNRLEEIATLLATRDLNYDAAGNLTRDRTGKGGQAPRTEYDYNAAGRLETATVPDGSTADYVYDPLSRQIRIETAAGVTRLAYGADDAVLEEADGAGTVKRSYIRLEGRPLAAVDEDGALYWILSDQVDQPVKLIDGSGGVVWDRIADPFGRTVAMVTGLETDEPARFPGQRLDALTGLHQNYHRDYDPATGRYLQSDPLGLIAGPSRYGYALQNPVYFTDPDGRIVPLILACAASPACAVGGAVISGIAATIAGIFALSQDPSNTNDLLSSLTGAETRDCPTCQDDFPNHLECWKLDDYDYESRQEAANSFGVFPNQLEGRGPIDSGPCYGTAGAGEHWNVKSRGMFRGSVTSCTCCVDDAGGAYLEDRFRAH